MNRRTSVLEDGIPKSRDTLNFANYSAKLRWTFAFGFVASIDIIVNISTLYDAVGRSSTYFYIYIFNVYAGIQLVGTVISIWIVGFFYFLLFFSFYVRWLFLVMYCVCNVHWFFGGKIDILLKLLRLT